MMMLRFFVHVVMRVFASWRLILLVWVLSVSSMVFFLSVFLASTMWWVIVSMSESDSFIGMVNWLLRC